MRKVFQLLAATCLGVIGVGSTILWTAIDDAASMLITCILFMLASGLLFYASYLDSKGVIVI